MYGWFPIWGNKGDIAALCSLGGLGWMGGKLDVGEREIQNCTSGDSSIRGASLTSGQLLNTATNYYEEVK